MRWAALYTSRGLLLSHCLLDASHTAWARASLAPIFLRTPNTLMPGLAPLRALFFEVLEYQSKMNIYLRRRNRRLQKFDRKAPKLVASLAFSPPRARLGQVARVLRTIAASRLAFEAEGLSCRLVSRDLLFLWTHGGLHWIRRVQNAPARSTEVSRA